MMLNNIKQICNDHFHISGPIIGFVFPQSLQTMASISSGNVHIPKKIENDSSCKIWGANKVYYGNVNTTMLKDVESFRSRLNLACA